MRQAPRHSPESCLSAPYQVLSGLDRARLQHIEQEFNEIADRLGARQLVQKPFMIVLELLRSRDAGE